MTRKNRDQTADGTPQHGTAAPGDTPLDALTRRHLRFGWCALLVYLALGIFLESLHGFKVGWYLDVSNETRRLMWTLAHTHGTLLALVNIALAVTAPFLADSKARRVASPCLSGATVIMPLGFFAAGVVFYPGDPGLGILLVPVGALLLFVAVLLVTIALFRAR